ncbi:hypothetical protein BH09SUM1_BH09SUM1_22870 [soil metagenome]
MLEQPLASKDDSSSCRTLADVFALLKDARKSKGRQYPLPSVLLLCLVAILHGCRNPTQIYVFGKCRPPLLRRLGFRPPHRRRGMTPKPKDAVACPNEDTIATLLRSLDGEEFNSAIAIWVARMIPRQVHAACDGKALKGAEEHVLEVFINDLRLVAWQMPVGEKENELSSLEKHLAAILARYPQIKLLTGDAMFCQKTLAQTLLDARRHYFLQLKAPHSTDVSLAQHALSQYSRTPPLAITEGLKGGLMAGSL